MVSTEPVSPAGDDQADDQRDVRVAGEQVAAEASR
jgi:hypothetical protein